MSIRPFRDIKRRKTKVINVGNVKIGGNNPISCQTMTNTLTTDIKATIKQINEVVHEGADLVRVSCPDAESTKALKEITRVSKKNSFITVDAYRNEEEKKRMFDWNLTAKTIMPVSEWEFFFKQNNYNGDYYWFIP